MCERIESPWPVREGWDRGSWWLRVAEEYSGGGLLLDRLPVSDLAIASQTRSDHAEAGNERLAWTSAKTILCSIEVPCTM